MDVQFKQFPEQSNVIVSLRHQSNRRTEFNSSTINQPTDAQLARYQLFRPLSPPKLLNFVYYVLLPPILASTHYVLIMTPL